MANIEIQKKELVKIVKIELQNDAIRVESGAMYYYIGNIDIEAKAPSIGGFLKSAISGEKAVKPVYRGTGELYLEPSYGDFTILEMNNEEWILDRGAYYASEMNVTVDIATNKALSGLFSGEGLVQTKVSGNGKVVIASPGPIEVIELSNNKLVVDGNFAVARTSGLEFKVEKATKGLFKTALTGEGIVNTFTGTGRVLICPAKRGYAELMQQFGGVNSNVDSVRSAVSSSD